MRRLSALVVVVAAALAVGGVASAAQLIDRNATGVNLAANAKGEALLTYTVGGRLKHILLWGAINARQPSKGTPQVKLKLDYAGGYGKYRTNYWQTFRNACKRYDGPALTFAVATCKAPDGTYWAAQNWQQPLPNLGYTPWTPALGANWLEVSHWSGPLAELDVHTDWIYGGRFHDMFGTYTYQGQPVYGFGTTSVGAPTDNYGRLIYLDTLDAPKYGPGWRRENSFVPHNPTGIWCYGFYSFDPTKGGYQHPPGQTGMRGPGNGSKYRLTAGGPGVTPNVTVVVPGLHDFNPGDPADVGLEAQQNTLLDQLAANDKGGCKQH
jgi:hypothetical protein